MDTTNKQTNPETLYNCEIQDYYSAGVFNMGFMTPRESFEALS